MTILIGYIPTPPGEAALDAGLAEAARSGDDVVILNSPRRGSHVDAALVDDASAVGLLARAEEQGVDRPSGPGRARSRHRRHLHHAGHGERRPPGRDRSASPQSGGQAGDGQRRAAAVARARRPGARRQARPVTAHRISTGRRSPRSPSRIRRCSTWSGSTSPMPCGRSSSFTPTTACWASARRMPDESHLARLRAVAGELPGHDPYDLAGLRQLVARVLAGGDGGAGASFGGMLDVELGARHRLLALRGGLPRRPGPPGRPPRQRPSRRRRPGARAVQRLPLLQVGRVTPATSRTTGARRSPPTPWSPRRDGWWTAGGSARSSSRAACCLPTRSARRSRPCATHSPACRYASTPTARWTPETSVKVAQRLEGVVEYLEDPTPGIAGMAQVSAGTDVPLATNMCVIAFEHLPPAIAADAVQVVLSDHHLWGGLRRSALLGGIARDVRPRAVDAQQQPPRHQPRRDGPPRRGQPQPHLRMRHPLPVEDRGPDRTRRAGVRGRIGGRPDHARPRRRRSTATGSASCTSSTSSAAYAGGRTPSTCRASEPDFQPNTSRW